MCPMDKNWLRIGVAMLGMLLGVQAAANAQKLVFVVRHAERADAGGMQAQMQTDPPLSVAGEARAQRLARMLEVAGIKAIYATEFRRTQDTAKPLAAKLGLSVRKAPSGNTEALIASLRRENADDIVLVVGHSNTVPAIVKAFGGPEIKIADSDYDGIYVVVPGSGTTAKILFGP
jgi:broad specificity phosphatase PhoE